MRTASGADSRGEIEEHVRLERVSKRFGRVPAVHEISLSVPPGSFTTLLGPSGCGKTTTLRMIAGFYDPDEGDIYISGRSQRGIPPHLRNVSIVFQEYALFPHMTVFDNVAYGLRVRGTPGDLLRSKVGETLAMLGLDGLDERYPHQLSGGQQQRVALARSLVIAPDVLLMDEPLSNLDAKLRVHVRSEIRQLQRRLGITTIYVTHDQEEALSISDRVAVMHEGRLLQEAAPQDLYFRPRNRFVAELVGPANFLPAVVRGEQGGRVIVSVGGVELQAAGQPPAGRQAVTLLVRPDWFRIAPLDSSDRAAVRGVVQAASFQGQVMRYWVRVPGLENPIVVDRAHAEGAPVFTGEVSLFAGEMLPYVLPEAG